MANLNVTVVGPPGYGRDIGKKGTDSDITFYNLKRGEDTVTLMEPIRYPERLAPLFYSASMAHFAIIVVEKIDHIFGEAVLMLDSCGVGKGIIVLRNFIVPEQVAPLIVGTVAENYAFVEDDPIEIRGRLIQEVSSFLPSKPEESEEGSVPVDHHFNVKGVGTVVLGSVSQGTIRKHDKLRVLPGEDIAIVRSIQKHDDNFDWAVKGERVGMALKGLDADTLDRGYVLSSDGSLRVDQHLEVNAELIRFWPDPIKEGMVLHIGHWMQFVPCKVASVHIDDNWRRPRLSLTLEKPLIHPQQSRIVLTYLDGGKLRVVGTAKPL
ncbi:MAG: elongation factor Tu [Methanomassiliicoccales archaeon]|nr:elongation factor Tu [Methanomassiliicoccales archaeon]NYT14790.1 elongation factor Tu [Methanomassiliicoccales archaeon]